MKAPQQSLKAWGDQKWRTKSGKPSSKTGERYLPEAAIKALSPKNTQQQPEQNEQEKPKGNNS